MFEYNKNEKVVKSSTDRLQEAGRQHQTADETATSTTSPDSAQQTGLTASPFSAGGAVVFSIRTEERARQDFNYLEDYVRKMMSMIIAIS